MKIWEKVLGSEHPDVALNQNNLGLLYHLQKKYDKAEPLYKRALATRKKVLEPNHPDVAQSLNNLAMLYNDQANLYFEQKKYALAKQHYERTLSIFQKVLGPNHLNTATILSNLAAVYRMTNHEAEAKTLEEQAAKIQASQKNNKRIQEQKP